MANIKNNKGNKATVRQVQILDLAKRLGITGVFLEKMPPSRGTEILIIE